MASRNCHSSIIWNDKLIIFGGYDNKGIVSEAISFDIIKKIWKKIPMKGIDLDINPASYAHKIVMVEKDVYIFGGYVEERAWLNDLYKISLEQYVISLTIE